MKMVSKGTICLALLFLFAATRSRADDFDVTLNTSSLSGTQILAFGFVDGDASVNNSVTLSGFTFGGGSAVGPADYLGTMGVSGDLAGSVTLDDSDFTALFTETFNPGVSLSFLLNTSNNFAGTAPDALAMYVCDLSFNCYSDDPTTAMLVLNLTGGPLTPASFILSGASDQGLPAPVVTYASSMSTTPEPASMPLIALGLLFVAFAIKRSAGSKAGDQLFC
jgi:hypothetical protein